MGRRFSFFALCPNRLRMRVGRNKSVAAFFKSAGISPQKRLGQHFLKDALISQDVVAACELENEDVVVEIGAGLGVLTVPLCEKAKKVFAIELDGRIAQILRERILPKDANNVEVVRGDALGFDFHEVCEKYGRKLKAVGNLPYSISTPILFKLIKSRDALSLAVLMFQKEVSDRIVAKPGNKSYGILSVLSQYFTKAEPIMVVSPESFYPQPKVNSAVVRLRFGISPRVVAEDETLFTAVVKAAFGKRRKFLRNALTYGLNLSLKEVNNLLSVSGIDGRRRAETLSVEEFVKLSNILKRIRLYN